MAMADARYNVTSPKSHSEESVWKTSRESFLSFFTPDFGTPNLDPVRGFFFQPSFTLHSPMGS